MFNWQHKQQLDEICAAGVHIQTAEVLAAAQVGDGVDQVWLLKGHDKPLPPVLGYLVSPESIRARCRVHRDAACAKPCDLPLVQPSVAGDNSVLEKRDWNLKSRFHLYLGRSFSRSKSLGPELAEATPCSKACQCRCA